MSRVFRTPEDYEFYIYSLSMSYPSILHSTLKFIRRGTTLAKIEGELFFKDQYRIRILERILYFRLPILIDGYGYEFWKGHEKIFWYDSQPHPGEQFLQSTHPHHKHIHPDIKHNRIPAPNMAFTKPNLDALIQEMQSLLS